MSFEIDFNNTYINLPANFYSRLNPVPVKEPRLIKINNKLAEYLGIEIDEMNLETWEKVFSGNKIAKNSEPLAMAYAGHQFGHWVPQLGDGRAILLGELISKDGIRKDIQLKGSGRTPFSRMGDGRAWLGPIIREYIISEAMYKLGIPTTRALSIVETGEIVIREKEFPGAILTRVANSHVRVGTFQYFASRQDFKSVKILADYVINRHYPNCTGKNKYIDFLNMVASNQAFLIAKWMSVGFIHGVMNTDNTSIVGETIDYGPCAFMDNFSFNQVFSSIDEMGRYSYKNQPEIIKWNLACLATCLLPLINEDEKKSITHAQNIIDGISNIYENFWLNNFRTKLGLIKKENQDRNLINNLLAIMEKNNLDFTIIFRKISSLEKENNLPKNIKDLNNWKLKYIARLSKEHQSSNDRIKNMQSENPIYIPRNHILEKVINESLKNNYSEFNLLNEALSNPYKEKKEFQKFSEAPLEKEKVLQTFCGT